VAAVAAGAHMEKETAPGG